MGHRCNLNFSRNPARLTRLVYSMDDRNRGYRPSRYLCARLHPAPLRVEVHMDKIESVNMSQGMLGRFFDYGDVTIRGTGTTMEPLHDVDRPIAFRNEVTAR